MQINKDEQYGVWAVALGHARYAHVVRRHCQDLECLFSIGIARLSINQGVLNFPEAFYR